MNPESSFESKIFIPRNIEGEPLKQELDEVRQIEDRLNNFPEFVSIICEGSIFKGYSIESSDIDLVLLYNSSELEYNSQEYWNLRNEISKTAKDTKEEIWEQRKIEKQRPRNITFRLVDINQDILENQFGQGRYDQLAYLFKLTTGERVDTYRRYWFEKINNLLPEEKTQLIEKLSNILSLSDIDYKTRAERIPSPENNDLLLTRVNLWRKHIEKI